jgi:polyisoprenoid-binding protein YceI
MKKIILPLAIVTTLLSSVNWKIAEGYSIKFTSKDPSGVFTSLKGNVSFDENNLAASEFDVTIDANSINTGNGMKNTKAKGEEWFNVEKYPTIKFTSDKISKTATGYAAAGTLDMHGVKKQITIPFTFSNKTFTGSFDINRLDYGVGTDKGMSAHASSVLKVDVSVPVTQ